MPHEASVAHRVMGSADASRVINQSDGTSPATECMEKCQTRLEGVSCCLNARVVHAAKKRERRSGVVCVHICLPKVGRARFCTQQPRAQADWRMRHEAAAHVVSRIRVGMEYEGRAPSHAWDASREPKQRGHR